MADEDVVRSRPEAQMSQWRRRIIAVGGGPRRLSRPRPGTCAVAARVVIRLVLVSRQSDSEGWAGRRDGVHFHAAPPAADGVVGDPGRRPGRRPGRSPSLLSPAVSRDRASVSRDMPGSERGRLALARATTSSSGGRPHACREDEAAQGDRRSREAPGARGQARGTPASQG
jgi:hypothetical protein